MVQSSKEPVQLPVRRVVPDELTLSVEPAQLPAPVIEQSAATESQPEPEQPTPTEQAARELLAQVGAESVATTTSKPLVDEWLDLELRLEMLKDEFEAQKAENVKAKKAVQKRINEIQNELRAESRGETYTPPVEEKPKQLQIQGTGD